jgi:hypothetical protein
VTWEWSKGGRSLTSQGENHEEKTLKDKIYSMAVREERAVEIGTPISDMVIKSNTSMMLAMVVKVKRLMVSRLKTLVSRRHG